MTARFTGIVLKTIRLGGLCVLLGAATASIGTQAAGASEGPPLEITKFTMQTMQSEGVPSMFTQAGGHPWALTTTVQFASELHPTPTRGPQPVPVRDPKDIVVDLPPGLLGNPNPKLFPRCPLTVALGGRCPVDSQIGVARIRFQVGTESIAPLMNVAPEKGQSAEFALETATGVSFLLTAHVVRREDGSYGLAVVSRGIPIVQLVEAETTFWGVPADPSHDPMRGRVCGSSLAQCVASAGAGVPSHLPRAAFLSLPTDCAAGPSTTTIEADSWEEPGRYVSGPAALMPGVTGCNLLSFRPEVDIHPETQLADAPVELGVGLTVPQIESTSAPVTPQVKDTVLTFPEGMSISPGIVDGIEACEESGPEGINFEGPLSEERAIDGSMQLAPGRCPDASIVGTAKAFSPLLDEPVEGHVYLARPGCGGPLQAACTEQDALDGNLYQLYLELGGTGALADTGVNLKVRGRVQANPATGQLTAIFQNTPQLPFSRLEVHLNGGPRAPLDNPSTCGQAFTNSDLTPWSAPGTTPEGLFMAGTPDATPSSSFEVRGCSNPPGLSPGFTAGTVTPLAGQFSAFILNFSRKDREQYIKGIQVRTPPGLLGMLSKVSLCSQSQAEDPAVYGECPAGSKIGTTRVASGAGSHPFEIEGSVYLTGPYRGAPFGLSIVTHAVAGPFNLGLVVVRARIDVDPHNSALTVTTDETGVRALPQIVFGVPLRLQRVTVNIDRPGFMFNPTNCAAQQIAASVSGSGQAVANVASPFAVGACKTLLFKPAFAVATSGRTSRASGASLDAKLSYPKGAMGNDANIARVKVSLPKQLPSYLPTLQKACLASTFDTNPALCPSGAIVGIARANTPLLNVGLSGPVYFVSHGGEEFPSLIIVLQGEGVRVDLTGSTFIKRGITSSTFKTIPDVPVNTFELFLPQGKNHALAANGNLCKVKGGLRMPTEMTAQNGQRFKQGTIINVTGCAPKKARLSRQHHAHTSARSPKDSPAHAGTTATDGQKRSVR